MERTFTSQVKVGYVLTYYFWIDESNCWITIYSRITPFYMALRICRNICYKKLESTNFVCRKEISQLWDKESVIKKAKAKGIKAEQKAKKKQIEEEILSSLQSSKNDKPMNLLL